MRVLVLAMLALIPLMTACSGAISTSHSGIGTDVSGRWTGTWVGTGLFNGPRRDSIVVELTQQGDVGYGRLVVDGAVAAESVPREVRFQGLGGIRIFAKISGSKVMIRHELDRRLFTADLTIMDEQGNQMLGLVRGSYPPVHLLLSRDQQNVGPQSAQVMPPAPPSPVVFEPPPPPPPPAPIITLAPQPPVEQPAEKPTETPTTTPDGTTADTPKTDGRPSQEEFVAVPELKPVFFDFDKSALGPAAVDVLTSSVSWLKENEDALLLIEGYCDERGTSEYNLALGDRRAKSVVEYLGNYGISRDRVSTISYGKERPVCAENTAECLSQNRRAEFRIKSR